MRIDPGQAARAKLAARMCVCFFEDDLLECTALLEDSLDRIFEATVGFLRIADMNCGLIAQFAKTDWYAAIGSLPKRPAMYFKAEIKWHQVVAMLTELHEGGHPGGPNDCSHIEVMETAYAISISSFLVLEQSTGVKARDIALKTSEVMAGYC